VLSLTSLHKAIQLDWFPIMTMMLMTSAYTKTTAMTAAPAASTSIALTAMLFNSHIDAPSRAKHIKRMPSVHTTIVMQQAVHVPVELAHHQMQQRICDPCFHAVHMVPCEGRLIQLWMYYRNGNPDDNHYAHPLDFIPVVDLNLKKVCMLHPCWS
jgi:hypothetical protein